MRSARCRDFAGEPQLIAGHGRDRYVYSPCEGEFSTALRIKDGGRWSGSRPHRDSDPASAWLEDYERLRTLSARWSHSARRS
jgi:hypothetical protein